MYYYDSYGQYKCTNDNLCPEEAKIYIQPLNKCTGDCKKEYIYIIFLFWISPFSIFIGGVINTYVIFESLFIFYGEL